MQQSRGGGGGESLGKSRAVGSYSLAAGARRVR